MTDSVTKKRRSQIMANIRSKNTVPEKVVRSVIRRMGYRFQIHGAKLPGKPDIVFPGKRRAIFVHGCFWHQHKRCSDGRVPKSNRSYWLKKLENNVARDKGNRRRLLRLGWRSLVIWECATSDERKLRQMIGQFLRRND